MGNYRRQGVPGSGQAHHDVAPYLGAIYKHAVLARGLAAAPGTASGKVRVLEVPEQGNRLQEGEILVAQMTNPDWLPTIRRAAALVADTGGMTCHAAAFVARELGVPCVVGTRTATRDLHDGTTVTADGAHRRMLSGRVEAADKGQMVNHAGMSEARSI